jgi:hypothetical protein
MCSIISLAIYFSFPIGLPGTKLKLKASQSTWYKLHLDQLVQINASIVWRWTRYHEVRRPEISLRHLTFSDSISRPTLSLAPISIIFDDISINSHWLEPCYQVSGPVKHFKNIYLQFIVSDPVWSIVVKLLGIICQHIQASMLLPIFIGTFRLGWCQHTSCLSNFQSKKPW